MIKVKSSRSFRCFSVPSISNCLKILNYDWTSGLQLTQSQFIKQTLEMPQPNLQNSFTKTYHRTPYAAIDPTQPSLSAAGKTVLITAGHTGIGFSVAQNFAVAGAAHVILVARRTDILEKSANELSSKYPKTEFHHFTSSITDYVKIGEIFSEIRFTISSDVDVLVTSAAYATVDSLDLTSKELAASFETNLFANSNFVKEFLANDQEPGKEKVILDISSAAAHLLVPKTRAHGVSKLAFTQWLAHLQQDMVDKNIRVHSFHPGVVMTDAARALGIIDESVFGDTDDVQLPGQFAVWLASQEATFLKGRFVWANWDVQELGERKGSFESDPQLLKVGLIGD